jgi:alpha-beta hydrolase superfamily lysophospholipase
MTLAGERAIDGYDAVDLPARGSPQRSGTAMLRCRSAQPSRRAVLHVRASADPPVPDGLAAWYAERAFHFYLAGLRLPAQAPVGARPAARYLRVAFTDLDAACAHLRQADGIASIIVSAQGRGAIAAALWRDGRPDAADALILHAPRPPAGASLALDIDCPVLVLADSAAGPASPARRRWPAGPRRAGPVDESGLRLGRHVTWLRRPAAAGPGADGQHGLFDELGRWLGAYMYGAERDRLL